MATGTRRDGADGAPGGLRRAVLLLALAAAAGCDPLSSSRDGAAAPPASGSGKGPWHFTEVGKKAGLDWVHGPFNPGGAFDAYDHGCGVAAGDFNGDGHADILLLTQCGPTGYFLGRGDGTFEDRSDLLAALNDGVRVGVAYGDFDEDGLVDFYVTFTRRPNALLRQNVDGTFTDVAHALGVDLAGHYSGASFVDVDGDGDLDLVVAGNIQFTDPVEMKPGSPGCPPGYKGRLVMDLFMTAGSDPSALFINGGPGAGYAFTEEAGARGIPLGGPDGAEARGFGDVTVLDYNRDGHPDLLFPEMFRGKAALLENDGTGHFTDVTAARIPRASYGSSNAAAEDFDGDGWPDLLMTDMHSDMWSPVDLPFSSIDAGVRYKGPGGPYAGAGDNPTGPLYGNTLWMSGGDGSFTESDMAWGAETFNPWGALAADFDNDGLVDAFIPSGMSNPWPYFPDVFLQNAGGGFVQRQEDLGFFLPPEEQTDGSILVQGDPLVRATRGCAAADFDEDGDLDIVCYAWHSRALLWRNDLPRGRHWIDVDLRGTAPRDPYGAEVEVAAGGRTQVRWMLPSRGYLSQSTRLVHVGLGNADAVDSVSVRWPDGTRKQVDHPPVDRRVVITQ